MPGDAHLVEQVARAICEQALFDRRSYAANDDEVDREWRKHCLQALAALEVFRGDGEAIASRRAARHSFQELLLGEAKPVLVVDLCRSRSFE